MTEASAPVVQKMYAEQTAETEGGGGAGGETEADATAEDAVDAEFEEVKEDQK